VIPNAKREPRFGNHQSHGLKVLKRAVQALGSRAVDKRTTVGKALAAWRAELLIDLGGLENVSTAKLALVEEAVLTKFLLSSINAWMLAQKSLVSGRNRGVLPVVRDRGQLVSTLKGLLEALGLERRSKQVSTLQDIVAEYASKELPAAEPPAHAESNEDGGVNEGESVD
jgi:hypothetical protein